LRTHVEAAQESLYGGQLVRFAEIPATANHDLGIFDHLAAGHTTAASFADMLKDRASKFYGAPLRRFLSELTANPDRHAKEASDIVAAFASEVTPSDASSEVYRSAKRFGLVVAGGIAATKAECTDWDPDEVWDSGKTMFDAWLEHRGSHAASDEERAIRQVRSLIETNIGKFPDIEGAALVKDPLGFKKAEDQQTLFLIWPETWRKTFCRGLDANFVLQVLKCRGHLVCNNRKRLQFELRIPGFEHSKRFYAVSEMILSESENSSEN
jgi:hypothetical protein